MIDLEIFDAGVKSISDFGKDDLMPHFIYCGDYYYLGRRGKLEEIILTKMTKYGIQSSILTMLMMVRVNLVTKEKVKKAAEGKLKNDVDWKYYKESINDHLERFFINLQNQKEVKCELVASFFTPKLTTEELKLVQEENQECFKTYLKHYRGKNPDVDVEEMKKSDSKSKYVHGRCLRRTFPLALKTSQFEDKMEIEDGTETKGECQTVDETEVDDIVQDAKKRKMQESKNIILCMKRRKRAFSILEDNLK